MLQIFKFQFQNILQLDFDWNKTYLNSVLAPKICYFEGLGKLFFLEISVKASLKTLIILEYRIGYVVYLYSLQNSLLR